MVLQLIQVLLYVRLLLIRLPFLTVEVNGVIV